MIVRFVESKGGVMKERRLHISRRGIDLSFEEACPCDKAPCGMVVLENMHPDCTSHDFTKVMWDSHFEEFCPGKEE